MKYEMEEYYKVLQYLRETHVDRQYPINFKCLDNVESVFNVEQYTECKSHPLIFKLSNDPIHSISEDLKFHYILNEPRDYVDIDYIEILLYSDDDLTDESISIGLSSFDDGNIEDLVLDKNNLSSFTNNNNYYFYRFKTRDSNTAMQKKDRRLGNIKSINLHFKDMIDKCYLIDWVMRVDQFNITLEYLDNAIEAGFKYIYTQLYLDNVMDIPNELIHLCYKAGAAYAWLIYWENQGKTMDDGTRLGRNYATRLFDQIDMFLKKFLETNPQFNMPEIDRRMFGFTTYVDYPLPHRHKKRRRRRF